MSKISIGRGIGLGLAGGFIGVIVMTIVMVMMFSMMGLPGEAFFAMVGIGMGVGVPGAAVLHTLTGLIIGVIFGAAVSKVSLFRITGVGKGIGLGILAGIVAFAVLFLPMAMNVLPSAMMTLLQSMQPQASREMIMQMAQSMLPALLGGGFVLHIIYGAVLGSVTGFGLKATPDGRYACKDCGAVFQSEKELMEHAQTAHKQMKKEFTCEACGESFRSKAELGEHVKAAHPMPKP